MQKLCRALMFLPFECKLLEFRDMKVADCDALAGSVLWRFFAPARSIGVLT